MKRPANHRRRVAAAFALGGIVLLSMVGCRHLERAPDYGSDSIFPLKEGSTWVFRVHLGEDETVDVITRVVSIEDGQVHMTSATTEYTYEIRDDGLYRPSLEAYFIRMPLEEGASWPGPHGGTVTVVATGESVTVPAGTYDRCVRIEEDVPVASQRQVHTFCPGVGPVRLEQFIEGRSVAVGELTGFGTGIPDES